MKISKYKLVRYIKPESNITINSFLKDVKEGVWEDLIHKTRSIRDKEKRDEFKKKFLPCVTLSGVFSQRENKSLSKHSGLVGIDYDGIESGLSVFEDKLRNDPYVFAFFRSASGNGLCVIFRIESRKHDLAFDSIVDYVYKKYEYGADLPVRDVARLRFVSYDPNLHYNPDALVFKEYLPEVKKTKKKLPSKNNIIFADSDINFLLEQIDSTGADITGGYSQWLEIGFALAAHFNEGGREIYHRISQNSELYDPDKTDKKFSNCVSKGNGSYSISTVFYYAKLHGLDIISPESKQAHTIAQQAKNGKQTKEGAIKNSLLAGLSRATAEQITEKVYASTEKTKISDDLSKIEELQLFLKTNYNFKVNEVSRLIECNGKILDTRKENTIWQEARIATDQEFSVSEIRNVINSELTPTYNPIKDWFIKNQFGDVHGTIRSLAEAIKTPPHITIDFIENMLTKWLVGFPLSVFGGHSPLCLVMAGDRKDIGKTEFFRRLLPEGLKEYYAESSLDNHNQTDDYLLMCQKLLIMIDEYDSAVASNEKKMKNILSKEVFSVREPYGHHNVDLKRLALIGATTNDMQVLNDPTGNRRFLVIETFQIDFEAYNAVNKANLFTEAYQLYKTGYSIRLSSEEKSLLKELTEGYSVPSPEAELLMKVFSPAKEYEPSIRMTNTEIKSRLEGMYGQKLSARKLGMELKRLNFDSISKKVDSTKQKLYILKENV